MTNNMIHKSLEVVGYIIARTGMMVSIVLVIGCLLSIVSTFKTIVPVEGILSAIRKCTIPGLLFVAGILLIILTSNIQKDIRIDLFG